MKPWMQTDQIELVEKILCSFGKQKIDVLEWGSGGSTFYFPLELSAKKIEYSWLSIEHKKEWFDKMAASLQPVYTNVSIHLFAADAKDPATINLDPYVKFPRKTGRKFDFILIDGRARARCLVEARFLIKPGGIIMLHDAEREKYHYVFPLFEKGKMVESFVAPHAVWISGDFEKLFT